MNNHVFENSHFCKGCRSYRATILTTHCPMVNINTRERYEIDTGQRDYRFGEWVSDSVYLLEDNPRKGSLYSKVALTKIKSSTSVNIEQYKFYKDRLQQYKDIIAFNS